MDWFGPNTSHIVITPNFLGLMSCLSKDPVSSIAFSSFLGASEEWAQIPRRCGWMYKKGARLKGRSGTPE